jgi:hypothetical protein
MGGVNKIFEIGVMKTGTSSFGTAMRMLGYKHKGWDEASYEAYLRHGSVKQLVNVINLYDSFDDGPWHDCDFTKLDKHFPNSKFVLLERDDDPWIKSLEAHTSPWINANDVDKKYLDARWGADKKRLVQEKLAWKNKKYDNIKIYFSSRERSSDLLVMNICGGDGWEKLCPFLKKPIPYQKFPTAYASQIDHF